MTLLCAAIDWGTSQFRLWLLDEQGNVVARQESDEGLLVASKVGFSATLQKHLASLNAPTNLPVIICGMAGSRNGWKEARYLDAPCALEEVVLNCVRVDNPSRDIRILPGVAQRFIAHPDVMRGEETQLLGLTSRANYGQYICLPGTHSKWVSIENGMIKTFATFMTGELFALLAQRSILKFSLGESGDVDPDSKSFLSALDIAATDPGSASSRLFEIRSDCLLNNTSSQEAVSYLSGLLIGLEIAGAISRYGAIDNVTIVSSSNLAKTYASALNHRDISVDICDGEEVAIYGLFYAAQELWGGHLEKKKA